MPSTWPGSQDSLLVSPSPQHPLPVSQTRSAALVSCGSASTSSSAPPLLRTQAPPLPGRPEVSPRLSRPLIRGGCAGRGAGTRPLSKHRLGRGAWAGTCPGTTRCPRRRPPSTPAPPALAGTRRLLTWGGVGGERAGKWEAAPPAPGSPLPGGARCGLYDTVATPTLGRAGAPGRRGASRRTRPRHPPSLRGRGAGSRL